MNAVISLLVAITLTLLFTSVTAFKSQSIEEKLQTLQNMKEHITATSKTIKECAVEVKASVDDVKNFIDHSAQTTKEGKCLVACILKRAHLIKNNKIDEYYILVLNKHLYTKDNGVMKLVKSNLDDCMSLVAGIEDFCEYASTFYVCFQNKSGLVIEIASDMPGMEKVWDIEDFDNIKNEIVNYVKDEL